MPHCLMEAEAETEAETGPEAEGESEAVEGSQTLALSPQAPIPFVPCQPAATSRVQGMCREREECPREPSSPRPTTPS